MTIELVADTELVLGICIPMVMEVSVGNFLVFERANSFICSKMFGIH